MAENAYLTPEELRMKKELFFLIYKLLANSECQRAANALREEIELYDLLPKRIDWLGNEHSISLEEMERNYSHIKGDHLLKICSRICEVIDKEIPPAVPGVHSLLGDGSQSLLRRKSSAPRLNACSALNARVHGAPLLPSVSSLSNYPSNIVSTLIARQNNGPSTINHTIPTKLYSKQQMHKRQLGHLSSVYCITFDRSGKYIITGADDLLVKIWSATDARLLATLRGHAAEITDLSVNYENTLLAAGSCDKMIRVWCLKTTSPVCILTGHTGQITSLKFCPLSRDNNRYLISTANDGCVCFWRWNASTNEFQTKPIKFNEKTKNGVQLICSSFSGGGAFLAVGSTDHCVRVYHLAGPDGPEKILEIEAHADQVDSLQFSNLGFRFVSGSKDGTASIWWYERQTWRSLTLNMNERLPGQPPPSDSDGRVRVNMVCWTCDDAYVITAVSDNSLKVWDSNTAKLIAILNNHEDDVFVVEAHPTDPRVFLSGGHDGRIILWDVVLRSPIKVFLNQIEGQGHGAIFDCKFSPDGQFFASTDSHGHITIYGFGSNERYKKVPKEVFFHTDYRPLIRDAHHYVIDEQTQCAPHLMPPPFLVDIDGNPYEPIIQRLVPGRENCNDEQLVPYISIQNERGIAEVLEPVSRPHDENQQGNDGDERPTIDYMIERLQQEQDRQRVNYEHGYAALPSTVNGLRRNNHSQSSEDPLRRVRGPGDVEGVRQSSGSWQSRDGNTSTPYWTRRIVVKPLHYSYVIKLQQQVSKFASLEEEFYFREQKRKPLVLPSTIKETLSKERVTRRKRRISQQRLGVVSRNNTSRSSRNTQNRRHSGIIDYENPEDLSTPEESGSNFSESAADSWEESSSESESESEEEEDDGWNFGNDAESSRRTKVKENKKFNGKRPKKTRRNDDSSSEGASSSKAHEESDSDSAHHTNHSDSDVSLVKVNSKVKVKPQIKITKYPDWLICVYPKRSPYFPQIGDEVVYIRVAHEHYLETVRKNKEYKLHARTQAVKRKNMKEEQLVKVTNIKYQLELSCSPIVLAILTLVVLDDDGKETNETFTVRYHDMPDVLDFLVLKQIYEDSIARDWKVKDRFKSIIDDKWWFGTIVNKEATKNNSYFQSLRVLWDSKEEELMSPWDLEQIDQHGDVKLENEGIPVSTNDRTPFYTPKNGEWPEHGMDYECDRIISGLEKIMETSWAEHFSAPVDLNKDCDYASLVPYPIDLSTIKARLENRMYRRLDAVKFDVNFIEHNAKASNEKGSDIRVKARLITTLCLRFIDDFNCDDPYIYIQEISQNKEMYESTENEDEENINGETSRNGRSSRKRKMKTDSPLSKKRAQKRLKIERREITSNSWKQQCKELVELMFNNSDSEPFRFQVDPILYPDYSQVVDTPMDLTTVLEQLTSSCYSNPNEFCKDINLIFMNSRNYNTNKRSRIYSMTCRLKAFFEDRVKSILSDYKYAKAHEKKFKRKVTSKGKMPKRVLQKMMEENVKVKRNCARRTKPFDLLNQPSTSGYSKTVISHTPIVANGYSKNKSVKNNKIFSEDEEKPVMNGVVNGVLKNNRTVRRKLVESDSEQVGCNGEVRVKQKVLEDTKAFNHNDKEVSHSNSETEIDDEKNDTDATEIAECELRKSATKATKKVRRRPVRQTTKKRANNTCQKRKKENISDFSDYNSSLNSPGTSSFSSASSESYIISRTSQSGGYCSEMSVSENESGITTRKAKQKQINYRESDYEYDTFGNHGTVSSRGRVRKLKGHAKANFS